MNINYCESSKSQKLQQKKVQTPATADSQLTLNFQGKIPMQAIINSETEFWGNTQKQQFANSLFLGPVPQVNDEIDRNLNGNEIIQENLNKCDIKIRICILNQNHIITEQITKQIYKVLQTQYNLTFVFDRQFQRLKIPSSNSFYFQLYFQCEDGFTRQIWRYHFQKQNNSIPRDIIVFEDHNSQFKFKASHHSAKSMDIKPLCFQFSNQILDQFYSTKFKLLNKSELLNTVENIKDLKGILYTLSQQNMGSRIIQKLLLKSTPAQIQLVVNEFKGYLPEMASNSYGNYVIQKLFKVSSPEMRMKCMYYMLPKLNEILKSKPGTHCLQQILPYFDLQTLNKIAMIISNQVLPLSTNQFSHHFLTKILHYTSNETLIAQLLKHFPQISTNKYGIVVMKKILTIGINYQKLKYEIFEKIQENFNQLAIDQYGHYFIEEVFMYYGFYEIYCLLEHMFLYFGYFAQNQYSSGIIRKAIQRFGDYVCMPIIDNIVGNQTVTVLMESTTGSFVLHRLLQMTQNYEYRSKLTQKMSTLSPTLNNYEKRCKWTNFFNIA